MSTRRFTSSTVSSSFLLGMAWKHLSLSLGLVLAIGLSQPAFATPIVDVIVFGDGSYDATSEGQFPGAKVVSGAAHIDGNGDGFANVQPGPFPDCPLCGASGPPGGSAFVRAEANGVAGALRARARSGADAGTIAKQGGATATLTDNIKFLGTPIVNFDIDLSSTLVNEGFSSLTFRFVRKAGSCIPGFECLSEDTVLAELIVDESRFSGASPYRAFSELRKDGVLVTTEEFIRPSYQFSYEFPPPFPGPFPPGFPLPPDSLDVFFELHTSAFSSGENTENEPLNFSSGAHMVSDQSAYIRIDNVISASGYNYPGRPGTQQEVPAPASLALLAIGLAGLVVARRRKRWEPAR